MKLTPDIVEVVIVVFVQLNFSKKADRQTYTHTNRLGQKTPLIKVSHSKQRPNKHFLGNILVEAFILLGKITVEAEAAVFLGLPRGRAGAGGGGTGGTLRGGRPRSGGSAGFSSSEVTAGFNLCTETTSALFVFL